MAGPVLNRIILVGKVDSQPEVVFGNDSQTTRVKFNLFVQRPQFSSDIPAGSDTIPVIYTGRQADDAAEQIKQDSLVLVEGSIYTRQTNSPSGTTLYLTEVNGRSFVILGGNSASSANDSTDQPEETIDDVPF